MAHPTLLYTHPTSAFLRARSTFELVLVSLTELQGQGYSKYHISVKYFHVVDFDLLLRKCRHCRNTFVKGSVETSWPCSLQFRILLGSELGSPA